jgi:capsular polysaccharide transport system ATP-binding protein
VILLSNITDEPTVFGTKYELLKDASFYIPRGRYALLSRSPELHRTLIDILARLRPPESGYVEHEGLVSWPIGRLGFVRGKLTGIEIAQFICSLYGVDRHQCINFLSDILSKPEYLAASMETWPPFMRQEFTFALALVPPFDIYVIDGAIPFESNRFTRLWQSLFEDIIIGKMLIFATYRQNQLIDYCNKGLVYEERGFHIDDDIDACVERYPARRSRNESIAAGGGQGDFDDFAGGEGGEADLDL